MMNDDDNELSDREVREKSRDASKYREERGAEFSGRSIERNVRPARVWVVRRVDWPFWSPGKRVSVVRGAFSLVESANFIFPFKNRFHVGRTINHGGDDTLLCATYRTSNTFSQSQCNTGITTSIFSLDHIQLELQLQYIR